MLLTKQGVERMVLSIAAAEDYGIGGHNNGEDRASELVQRLSALASAMPDRVYVPDSLLPWAQGSVLGDVIGGYGRPLGYLCRDCRYPRWLMTPEECTKAYSSAYTDFVGVRDDGFAQVIAQCAKCG